MVSVYYRDKSKIMRRIKGVQFRPNKFMNQLSIDKSVYTLSMAEVQTEEFAIYQEVK